MQRSFVGFCQKMKCVCSPTASPKRSANMLTGRMAGSEVMTPPALFSSAHARRSVSTGETAGTANVAGSNISANAAGSTDPFQLVGGELTHLIREIHSELDAEIRGDSELAEVAKYYFDGKGKAIRPVISLCVGHAVNAHVGSVDPDVPAKQRKVAIISEMIHTASLFHDDVMDHAETRRGKTSVNLKWNPKRSVIAGDYVLSVGSKLLARIGNADVVQILSQVLSDLVEGEFMQLQNKMEEEERFQHYLDKSFNKTASLMAYSCKANAVLSGAQPKTVESAFQYGRNIGIAFQLVDDLLDFVSSADMLGKPAAADMELGLATAPVLFAAKKYPELDILIARRFSEPNDIERAFKMVIESDGLDKTKALAKKHCQQAVDAVQHLTDSQYKASLITLCDKVVNRLN